VVGRRIKKRLKGQEEHESSSSSSSNEKYLDQIRKNRAIRAHFILRSMPWSLPFEDRLLLFQSIIQMERDRCQDGGDVNSAIRIRVRRSSIFQDTYTKLNKPNILKKRIYVVFINPLTGEDEKGIDAGGLFKELWTSLSNVAFDPNYGLWDVTPDGMCYVLCIE
jgi:ubiquitin-protein ligase E3 C